MAPPRQIVIVTGTRAEYGLLLPVMRAVAARDDLILQPVVTGTHLTAGTLEQIEADGLNVDEQVVMQQADQTGRAADVQALGRGISGFGAMFEKHRPDFVVVLGDRIEAFAAASAAAVGGVRVAHLHGGDRAQGVADEAMRHAISKLAHLHLAATAQSQARLIRMGEPAPAVFNVGSPAADALHAIAPAKDAPHMIVMQHPVGQDDEQERQWMTQTLWATAGADRLVMAPNADPGRDGIGRAIADAGLTPTENLPRDRFLSLLMGAQVVVGNSSAGLIEAAILRTPCVNIGPRQAGREQPGSVVNCAYGKENVANAVAQATRLDLAQLDHPYGDGHTGERVAHLLATVSLQAMPLRKCNAY